MLSYYDFSELPESERVVLEKCLAESTHTFALFDSEIGSTDLVKHEIDTGNAPPIKQLPCRTPFAHRAKLEQLIQDLLDRGWIKPSCVC